MNKKISLYSLVLAGAVGATFGISNAEEAHAKDVAKVNASSLTVRSGASVNYKAIDYIHKNQSVTILADYGSFSKISYNGKTGYVNDSYLTITKEATAQTYKVSASLLNVRSQGNASSKILTSIKKNTKVTVLNNSGTWWKVKVGNVTGYVNKNYLTKSSTSSTTTNKTSVGTYKVTVSSLNLRKSGTVNASILKVLKKNATVSVLSNSGTWWKVKSGNTVGYVNKAYLAKANAAQTNTTTSGTRMYVKTSSLNLRSAGNVNAKILKSLKLNTAVTVVSKSGTWWKVKAGGVTGYVNKSYLSTSTVSSNSSSNSSTVAVASSKLKGKVIVIDPGHGGKFPGSQGIVHEEDTNLAIALKTRDALKKQGATVVMTRTSDVHLSAVYNNDLYARSAVANNLNASMFISIHANAGGGTGTEVFYNNASRGDKKLATEIVTEIAQTTGLKNRGAKQFAYAVIRNTKSSIPSVLVETAFTDTKFDAGVIGSSNGQNKMANSIAEGVLDYYGK